MGQFQFINLDQSGGVLTAALNRPKANAFNETMIEEWLSILKIADRDESVRCLVLTGTGRIFSAGQDVAAIRRGELSLREHLHRTHNRVLLKLHAPAKPIVAPRNAPAVGAGRRASGEAAAAGGIPRLERTRADAGLGQGGVVSAPAGSQRARVLARPGMPAEAYEAILARQTPDAEKRARADHIIDTGGSKDHARAQVAAILDAITGA